MQKWIHQSIVALGISAFLMVATAAFADDDDACCEKIHDFGQSVEKLLQSLSQPLFGIEKPLQSSASTETVMSREPDQSANDRQLLAKGLKAEFVARNVAFRADMIAFWPDDLNYTHLILCIEGERIPNGAGHDMGVNPSIQRVNVMTGKVETVLLGMNHCDGIRATQWGTVLATEETKDGAAYEILHPLDTTGHWIANRASPGEAADIRTALNGAVASANVVKRTALVTQAWEGLDVLDNGVVLAGNELRPDEDHDGGAIFRFVPTIFYPCQGAPVRPGLLCDNTIDDLNDSPLRSEQNYALFIVCSKKDDYGQGCEYGPGGRWVEVNAVTARADASANGATGYCRPEDLHVDTTYGEFNGGEGIRWGWTNTCGGEGEMLFVEEGVAALDAQNHVTRKIGGTVKKINFFSADGIHVTAATVTRFIEGDAEMNGHDNLAIQPITGNVYIIEGDQFGDVWACLQDGKDRDQANDGCVRILSVRDPDAEATGFIFDGTGQVAFYNIQHGQQHPALLDPVSNPTPGEVGFTDDLVKITGFTIVKKRHHHHGD
ncbi:MAG: hypothetical protein GKS05_09290 [Nitrospirales bacterium]|nr:hypothetical protein [Nitrospirales bacterium]